MTLKSVLETILFVHGEAMTIKKLAVISGSPSGAVTSALEELMRECQERGITVVQKDDAYQLGSHPDNIAYARALMKNEFTEALSRSALETIAIIAYKGPLTRAEIEYIRGVNSSFTLRNLMVRGLIELATQETASPNAVEREENTSDSRAYRYRVSIDFLKYLGLTKIDNLPQYEQLHDIAIPIAPSTDES